MNREDFKDNPLLAVVLTFQDGAQLGLRMKAPVPQVKAMAALGHFAADVGMPSLAITLPRPTKHLVAEAIERFLGARGGPDEAWSSEEMAEAILLAANMPDDLASVLFAACEAQHQGMDLLFAGLIAASTGEVDKDFLPSKSGLPWEAIQKGNAAMEMARPILQERDRARDLEEKDGD
jgi:hypothetical protein